MDYETKKSRRYAKTGGEQLDYETLADAYLDVFDRLWLVEHWAMKILEVCQVLKMEP